MGNAVDSLSALKRKTDPFIGIEGNVKSVEAREWSSAFKNAIADDLNSSAAIGVLNLMLADSSIEDCEKAALIKEFDSVLGLRLLNKPEKIKRTAKEEAMAKELIEKRNVARIAKNWAESDRLRDELLSIGVVIKDGKNGTEWEWK